MNDINTQSLENGALSKRVWNGIGEDNVRTAFHIFSDHLRAQGKTLDLILKRLDDLSATPVAAKPPPAPAPKRHLLEQRDALDKLIRRAAHSPYGTLTDIPASLTYDAQGIRGRAHSILGPGVVRVIEGTGEIAGYVTRRRK
jgi:hypothetical protein